MTQDQIYQNIAQRTGGDIYLGVVGPVRSGKSTFIKRFAELMLLPRIKNEARRARAHDELPQSAAGRTIMTTEPKFIPEKAVKLELSGGGSFKARLIDCVGYMVDGALGHEENEAPRLVKSPWFDHEVPFDLAAETGTRCVIREHATVGLVVTTDGSVADLPREAYLDAERRIIAELDGIGKPYIILLNCAEPDSDDAQHLAAELAETYGHAVLPLNCTTMTVETLDKLLQTLLYEFPIREIAVQMPAWVTMLESGHMLKDITLPENTLVMMVCRNGEYFVPQGKTELLLGDKLLVISDRSEELATTHKDMGIDDVMKVGEASRGGGSLFRREFRIRSANPFQRDRYVRYPVTWSLPDRGRSRRFARRDFV